MANIDVKMMGFKQARKNLRALVSSMAAEKQVDALKKGASVLQASAAARVPAGAGAPSRGGKHLKDAIGVEVRVGRENHAQVAVGPEEDQYHGVFIELGTIDMPADPYLRPAVDSEGDEAARIARRELRREVVETTVELRKRSRLLKDRRRVGESKRGKKIRGGEKIIGGGKLLPAEDPRDTL